MLKNKLYLYGNNNVRVPAHSNVGKEVFDSMVKNKYKTALIDADTGSKMAYGEVAHITEYIALMLTNLGVGKGDVVCICLENNLEYLPSVLGIICTGAICLPMDPSYEHSSLMDRLIVASPKVMFCSLSAHETHKQTFHDVGSIRFYIIFDKETKGRAVLSKMLSTGTIPCERFKPVPVNGWEDVAFILFSSETTKPVCLTHLRFLSESQHMLVTESKYEGVYISGKFYSSYNFLYALACLRANATVVFNRSGGEKNMLQAVQKYKLQVLQLSPKDVIELTTSTILDRYDVSSVKLIVATGTHIWDETVRTTKQRFPNPVRFLRQYWTTEAGLICHEQFATKGCRAESAGRPANGVVIKVVDLETREPLGPNQRGEICVKGYWVGGRMHPGRRTNIVSHWTPEGRHRRQDCAKNAIPDFMDEEGFLKTGDVGYYDVDGYIYIVNRIKDFIKFNGIALAPADFEALLIQHRSVREAAVVGKINLIHGEVPVAFVVLKPGRYASEEELVQFVDSRVPFNMRLAGGVCFIEQLPLNLVGKVDRNDLVQRLLEEDLLPPRLFLFPML